MCSYEKKKLNNGLECRFCSNNKLHSISIGLYIKAGLIHEDVGSLGISHLIEHLFFRRMADVEQKDLYYSMESIGATLRGVTFLDGICFELKVLPQYFNKAIMGKKSCVKSISAKKIKLFMNKIISPKNSCLVITGNFSDIDLKTIVDLFNNIKMDGNIVDKRTLLPLNYCQRTEMDNFIDDIEWQTSEVLISFDVPLNLNINCVSFISSILGEGVGSKLSMLLREELGLTNEIYSEVNKYPGINRLVIKFMVNNVNLEVALKTVFQVLNDIKIQINKYEFYSSKIFLTENRRFLYDNSAELNFIIGYDGFIRGNNFISIENIIHNYNIISIKDLEDTAKKLFVNQNMFIVVSNNKNVIKQSKIRRILNDLRKSIST